jgi:hypothetical protein
MHIMSRSRRQVTSPDAAAGVTGRGASPPALRTNTSRLRDPKLWLGIVLVAASALLGGRIVATADDTVAVWSVAHDIRSGAPVGRDDLELTDVHFADGAPAGSYLLAASPLPSDVRAVHDLGEGELLANSAVARGSDSKLELPLGVEASDLPADLSPGDRVAVWAVPAGGNHRRVVLVLDGASVGSVSGGGSSDFGSSRQVLLEVATADEIAAALRMLSDARAVLVRVGT